MEIAGAVAMGCVRDVPNRLLSSSAISELANEKLIPLSVGSTIFIVFTPTTSPAVFNRGPLIIQSPSGVSLLTSPLTKESSNAMKYGSSVSPTSIFTGMQNIIRQSARVHA
jgi:hypothetical protein